LFEFEEKNNADSFKQEEGKRTIIFYPFGGFLRENLRPIFVR